jgi:hypothetical protein
MVSEKRSKVKTQGLFVDGARFGGAPSPGEKFRPFCGSFGKIHPESVVLENFEHSFCPEIFRVAGN